MKGRSKLKFWFASAPAWIFSAASKYFVSRHRLSVFPTKKHPKVTRLAFARAQVLEWVLCSNCNCLYSVFFLHFCGTILTIRRYARSLKLWNEVSSNKFPSDYFTSKISDEGRKLIKIPHRTLFFGYRKPEILLPVA